jgi:hypothetical protein
MLIYELAGFIPFEVAGYKVVNICQFLSFDVIKRGIILRTFREIKPTLLIFLFTVGTTLMVLNGIGKVKISTFGKTLVFFCSWMYRSMTSFPSFPFLVYLS